MKFYQFYDYWNDMRFYILYIYTGLRGSYLKTAFKKSIPVLGFSSDFNLKYEKTLR